MGLPRRRHHDLLEWLPGRAGPHSCWQAPQMSQEAAQPAVRVAAQLAVEPGHLARGTCDSIQHASDMPCGSYEHSDACSADATGDQVQHGAEGACSGVAIP
jgi:hypothetical protein